VTDAIERAKELGTLNKIDRSHQYTRPDNPELLRSLNQAWTNIRVLENGRHQDALIIHKLHERVGRYRIITIALTSILTSLAWEGCKVVVPRLLWWFGIA
jgi:hypothetical protein